MGALITDAMLQAGINYKNVVKPRAERIEKDYPEGNVTSGFLKILLENGSENVLDFKGEKPKRVLELTQFLNKLGIESILDFKSWLEADDKNIKELKRLKGIGNKTADYLKLLVGIKTNAVDRHLINFLGNAGIPFKNYNETHKIIEKTAQMIDVDVAVLDHSIWSYMSED